MEEKTYIFHVAKSGQIGQSNEVEVIEVKESELTQAQKNLLFADFLKEYQHLPMELQEQFVMKALMMPKINHAGQYSPTNGLNIKQGSFTPENIKTSEYYETNKDGHVVPKPMKEQVKKLFDNNG